VRREGRAESSRRQIPAYPHVSCIPASACMPGPTCACSAPQAPGPPPPPPPTVTQASTSVKAAASAWDAALGAGDFLMMGCDAAREMHRPAHMSCVKHVADLESACISRCAWPCVSARWCACGVQCTCVRLWRLKRHLPLLKQ
jgi:hypothetical protein